MDELMEYIVLEVQTSDQGAAIVPPTAYKDRLLAERAYHLALASAAVSEMLSHTVMLLTNEGHTLAHETYHHIPVTPEPEVEPEIEPEGE